MPYRFRRGSVAVVCVRCFYPVGKFICVLDVSGNDGKATVNCSDFRCDHCYDFYGDCVCVCGGREVMDKLRKVMGVM